jgi:hypothetical protein
MAASQYHDVLVTSIIILAVDDLDFYYYLNDVNDPNDQME